MLTSTLSLVIPAHNEEKILSKNAEVLCQYLSNLACLESYELILVDNGSDDKTPEILAGLTRKFKNIKAIRLEQRDLGGAIKAGILNSKNKGIMFYAIDLPFGLNIIEESIKEIERGFDFVIGSKGHPKPTIKRPFSRALYSKIYHLLLRLLFNLKIKDTQGSFIGKKDLLLKAVSNIEARGAWFQTKIVLELAKIGAKMKEIPITYTSESRSSRMKIRDGLRSFKEIFAEYFKSDHGKERIILLSIILLAILLRLPYLSKWPAGFSQDEASKGYQAYSILKTGRDYRGRFLPMAFTDFSDKLPSSAIIYTYATIPSVALFGLNERAVRLPAALFGIATILLIYLLCNELFDKKNIALLASFFLAVSPWHILMSRYGTEPITLPFFFFLGWLLFQKGIDNKKYLYIGTVVLGLSLYAYQTALLFIPIFYILFFFLNRKSIKKRSFFISTSILITTAIPIAYMYLSNSNGMLGHFKELSTTGKGDHIERAFYFLNSYVSHLNPYLLSYLYLFPVIFFSILGIRYFLPGMKRPKIALLLLTFLLSIVPPALVTKGFVPYPTRSIGMVGFLEIFAAFGLFTILQGKTKFKKLLILTATILGVALSAGYLIKTDFPQKYNPVLGLQYGFKEVIEYASSVEDKYQKVIITNKASQPFIFLLFHKSYPPQKFQDTKVNRRFLGGPYPYEVVDGFDKYKFCNINRCYKEAKNYLYIARANERQEIKAEKVIRNKDGSEFRIFSGLTNVPPR